MAVLFSCSKDPIKDIDDILESHLTNGQIVISGCVTDMNSNAIEGIKVTMNAFLYDDSAKKKSLCTVSSYTNNEGVYKIQSPTLECRMIVCDIEATDIDDNQNGGTFSSSRQEVLVTWNDVSLDQEDHTFYINGCNFHLK